MRWALIVALALCLIADTASAKTPAAHHIGKRAEDRPCTAADVVRFEAMLGGIHKGEYRSDPRFAVTIHYLGTAIVDGTCEVALRPAD